MVDLTYQPQIQPEGLPGRALPRLPEQVPAGAFGGSIGHGLEEAGSIIEQHVRAAQQQARQSQLTDAHNQMQALSLDLTHNPQTGAFTKQGKDAFGLSQQYLPQFDEAAAKIVAGVRDPHAQVAATEAMGQVRNHLLEQLDTHELEQHRQFGISTARTSVSLAQQTAAANYNHPDILSTQKDHIDVSLESLGQQQGWTDEQLQEAKYQAHVQMHQGVLTNMLADNQVGMAKAYLDTVKGELKPQELKEATRAIQTGQVKSTADSIMAAYGADTRAGATAMTHLPDSGLSQEQQFQVAQEVERQRSILVMQRRQDPQIRNQLSGLQDSIAIGKPSAGALSQIEGLWRHGALSDEQRQSLRDRVLSLNQTAPDDQIRMSWITDHYQNSTPIDPKSTDNQKLVGQLFTRMTQGVQPGSQEYANYAAETARRVGVIPEPAVAWARAHLVGGEPAQAAQAADLLSRVSEASPRDVSYAIDGKTKAMALSISNAVKAGANPQAAVEVARKNSEMSEGDAKLLDSQYRKLQQKNPQAQASDLVARLKQDERYKPGYFYDVPKVPTAMQTEYDDLTRQYFQYTGGDINQARTLATADIKHIWGVSEVNGQRELMAYAPEARYPGLTPEIIRQDIATAVPGREGVRLALDPQRTARTQGSTWNLVAPDENGMLEVMRDAKGNPLQYQLPLDKSSYSAARQPQVDTALRKARELSELRARQESLREEDPNEMLGTGVPEPH